jgi:hypothetical protein
MKIITLTIFTLLTASNGMVNAKETSPCNMKSFAKILIKLDKVSDEVKELAIAELKMAREKLVNDDTKACSLHLTNASDAIASN